jgi:GT2 family glycosyltransferase
MSAKERELKPKVYVIVLNWNGGDDTVRCLSSLQLLTYENYSVMVVDNGSTDDSPALIREAFPEVEFLETGRNLGFAGGCNVGIRRALTQHPDFIWLLNNDTTVDPGALTAMVEKAGTDSRIGVVGSAIYNLQQPERLQCWGGGYINFLLGRPRHFLKPVDDGKLHFITGASFMISRAAVEAVGELDERFFMYWEDADYCFRLRRAGWRIGVAGQSKVWHKALAETGKGSVSSYQYFNASAARFFEKHASVPVFSFWSGFAARLAKRLVIGDWEKTQAVWAGMRQKGRRLN